MNNTYSSDTDKCPFCGAGLIPVHGSLGYGAFGCGSDLYAKGDGYTIVRDKFCFEAQLAQKDAQIKELNKQIAEQNESKKTFFTEE